MKSLIYKAIEKAQRLNYDFKEGAYSLDFFKELMQEEAVD